MFCSVCGTKINENAKFCFECGAKIGGTEKDTVKVSQKEISKEFVYYVENKIIEAYSSGKKNCSEIFSKRAKLYEVQEEDLRKIIAECENKISRFEMFMETVHEECTLFTLNDDEIYEVMQFGKSLGFSDEDIEKLMGQYDVLYHIVDKRQFYLECISRYVNAGVTYFTSDDKYEEHQIDVYKMFQKNILEFEKLLEEQYKKADKFELNQNQMLLIYTEGEKLFPKKEIANVIHGYDKKTGISVIREEIENQKALERMTIFDLYGEKVAFTEEECIGINIGKHYRKEFGRVQDCFLRFYNNTECTKEGYWTNLNETVIRTIHSIYEGLVKNLNSRNIPQDNLSYEDAMAICQFWIPTYERIEDEYNQICLGAEQAEYYRKLRKANRGKWSGGGFGLKGAIKGAATAGALNLATGAAHSAFNFVGNVGSEVKKLREIRKLFNNSLKNEIISILKKTTLLMYELELNILAEHNILCKGFKLFYDNEKINQRNYSVQMFKDHPFEERLYEEIIMSLGVGNGQMDKLAQFTGIRIVEMKAKRKKKERAERTADGIVFQTIGEKEAYCAERKIYKPILQELGNVDVWVENQKFNERIVELKQMKKPTVKQWVERVEAMLEWCENTQRELAGPNSIYLMKLLQELKVDANSNTIIVEKNEKYNHWIEFFAGIMKFDKTEKIILAILDKDKQPKASMLFTTNHIYYYYLVNKEHKYVKFDFDQICDVRFKEDEEKKNIATFEIRVSNMIYRISGLFDAKETPNYKYGKTFYMIMGYFVNVGFKRKSKEAADVIVQETANMSQKDRYDLAISYLKGVGNEKNEIIATKLLDSLVEEGYAKAQWSLGHYYYYYSSGHDRGYAFGDDADRKRKKEVAEELFIKAAEQGHPEAQNMVASFCSTVFKYSRSSKHIVKDDKKAVVLYRQASEQGNSTAMRNLAWHYFEGVGVAKNVEVAVRLLTESAELGDIGAQVDLGDRYKNGDGVNKSVEYAIYWYNEAAKHNDLYASNRLDEFRKKYNVDKILERLQVSRSSTDSKFCVYCGKNILKTVKFCNFCGKNVSNT